MHEEAAILAMFLAGTQLAVAKAPDSRQAGEISSNMRAAAKGYLERLVGVSADRVDISANGLIVKPD